MTTKHITFTAIMTAIIALLGLVPPIPLPFMPVPIVLQNIGIFLAGILLGKKYGTISVIVFLILAACGLPVLSGGRGGIGLFAGPSAGFLFLYPVVAFLIGWYRDRTIERINFIKIFIPVIIAGVLLLDIAGTLIMGMITNMPLSKAFFLSFVFMPGDIVKAVIASLIGAALLNHTRFKQLIRF
ncbi:biotin transporter BioY [Staphylococcus carnosus]|uniref:Biotin transporter n=2 Tax=Staphylococcus carnosus TaxID=1281 RepID=B9DLX3_STACT|nr:biotin transporter BioY [Staphylococcus carnosus]ANZ32719.1 biotin biosynthesis protein BioY [Staphylococcus carnosus]KKB25305.1 biotin biosynthesis protein BioY [Staphylococcus carnosus]KOR12823.1 biotin biosynthesis protein BioY [Staphylococcus carnosus]POA04558.1 biotin transporter BioY [Staphylococcus carnosus]QQS84610.1 biotin transporter BioY [Staphylococcus carnosus]